MWHHMPFNDSFNIENILYESLSSDVCAFDLKLLSCYAESFLIAIQRYAV
jgi:hypothetical protein